MNLAKLERLDRCRWQLPCNGAMRVPVRLYADEAHLVREVFATLLSAARLPLLYDVSHYTCKVKTGRAVQDELAQLGILIRSPSLRGIAEEAPGAFKDVSAVVDTAESTGLARKVARLEPLVCIKG